MHILAGFIDISMFPHVLARAFIKHFPGALKQFHGWLAPFQGAWLCQTSKSKVELLYRIFGDGLDLTDIAQT